MIQKCYLRISPRHFTLLLATFFKVFRAIPSNSMQNWIGASEAAGRKALPFIAGKRIRISTKKVVDKNPTMRLDCFSLENLGVTAPMFIDNLQIMKG